MTHDVFISYSSKDKITADAVCARLEQDGIRCWMAPRDIRPGREWGEAIIEGIEGSRVFLLIFSSNANESQQIRREVERAVNRSLVIVPFRIEDVAPGRSLEYFISTPHWLDAMTPPLEQHINYLSETLQVLLTGSGDTPPRPPAPPPRPAAVPLWRRPLPLAAAAAAVLLVLAVSYAVFREPPPIERELVGQWRFVDTLNNAVWTQTNERSGDFEVEMTVEETGTFDAVHGGRLRLEAPGRQNAISSWEPLGAGQVKADGLVPSQFMLILNFYSAGKGGIGLYREVGALVWESAEGSGNGERPQPGQGSPQTWKTAKTVTGLDLAFEITFGPGAGYRIEARMHDTGKLRAKESRFNLLNGAGAVHQGPYEIIDDDTVSMGAPPFQQTWRRMD